MKKELFRISGKSVSLPGAPKEAAECKYEVRPGGWVIVQFPDGSRTRIAAVEARGRVSASLGGVLFSGEIQQERSLGAEGSGGNESDLVAQFPGKVRKILVAEGQKVADGEPLILVEAMKMEFAIKAPFAGKIARLLVSEGQQLSPGDKFLDLETAGS